MNKITLFFTLVILATNIQHVFSQGVGINEDKSQPHASAMIDVKSTTKGVLLPRMTQTQRDNISSPTKGLSIYQTGVVKAGFYYHDGAKWQQIASQAGSAPPGTIVAFAGVVDNTTLIARGWHKCDGRSVSRTDPKFKDLFAAIGTAWGDGTQDPYSGGVAGGVNFNIPDLRAMFLRGVNDTRADAYKDPEESSRSNTYTNGNTQQKVGSVQTHMLKRHEHGPGNLSGTTNMKGNHSHPYQKISSDRGTGEGGGGHWNPNQNADDNAHTGPPNGNGGVHSHTVEVKTGKTDPKGGDETRPKNAYVYYIIKL